MYKGGQTLSHHVLYLPAVAVDDDDFKSPSSFLKRLLHLIPLFFKYQMCLTRLVLPPVSDQYGLVGRQTEMDAGAAEVNASAVVVMVVVLW